MIPHPVAPFAMNQNGDALLGCNQGFAQDQGLVSSNVQAQRLQQALPPMLHQNPMNAWQQAQLAMSANQQLPALNMQFGQLPWTNQMSNPQQLQNVMLQMAPFNMPFLSQQIIQEACSMSQPVDAADEPILLTTLLKAKKSERNFKEALNGLHGNNGHSASLWKDYYLEHKDRLDDWIEMCMKKEKTQGQEQASLVTVKKPSPASFKPLPNSSRPSGPPSSRHPSVKTPKPPLPNSSRPSGPPYSRHPSVKTPKPPLPSRNIPRLEGRGRNTLNSLSVPEPVFGSKLPAPNAAIRVPDPPSRSPSPPTNIVAQRRGNKFTTEDREFFIKFIGWRLRQDPGLNRQELCEMLAEKAPHHTGGSWTSFWSNNHDLPDKILASARGEVNRSDDEEERIITKISRPNYRDVTTSESDESGNEQEQDDSSDDSETSSGPVRRYSESEMGERNAPFTAADFYFTAKYVASIPDWAAMKTKDRWEPFHEKHPQRTAKSWAESYRRFGKKLSKLVKKIQRENDSSSIASQLGRPSKIPPRAKRRFDDDERSSDDERALKHTRIENSE